MKIEKNKEIMKKFEKAINTADEKLITQLVDDEALFFTPASPDKPLYGGKGYLSLVLFMRSSFSDVQWELEDIVTEDDKVAVSWKCTGIHDGEFMGIAPTGKSFTARMMNFYYFNEKGKIIRDIAAEGMIAIIRAINS